MTQLAKESQIAEGHSCRVVRAGADFQGKQGLTYAAGITAESVGAQGIHLQIVTIPPGGRAKAHKHAAHKTAIHVLSGVSGMWCGEQSEDHFVVQVGDFLYIPADMPHLPYNQSRTNSCVAMIARTDPNEQESVVLLPHLDAIHPLHHLQDDGSPLP